MQLKLLPQLHMSRSLGYLCGFCRVNAARQPALLFNFNAILKVGAAVRAV